MALSSKYKNCGQDQLFERAIADSVINSSQQLQSYLELFADYAVKME